MTAILIHQERYRAGLIRLTKRGSRFNLIYYHYNGRMQSYKCSSCASAVNIGRCIKKSFFKSFQEVQNDFSLFENS